MLIIKWIFTIGCIFEILLNGGEAIMIFKNKSEKDYSAIGTLRGISVIFYVMAIMYAWRII